MVKKEKKRCRIKIRDDIKKQVLPRIRNLNKAPFKNIAYIKTSRRMVKQSKNQMFL